MKFFTFHLQTPCSYGYSNNRTGLSPSDGLSGVTELGEGIMALSLVLAKLFLTHTTDLILHTLTCAPFSDFRDGLKGHTVHIGPALASITRRMLGRTHEDKTFSTPNLNTSADS